jgi:hypothetical protein
MQAPSEEGSLACQMTVWQSAPMEAHHEYNVQICPRSSQQTDLHLYLWGRLSTCGRLAIGLPRAGRPLWGRLSTCGRLAIGLPWAMLNSVGQVVNLRPIGNRPASGHAQFCGAGCQPAADWQSACLPIPKTQPAMPAQRPPKNRRQTSTSTHPSFIRAQLFSAALN